jgi:hypothetical protein
VHLSILFSSAHSLLLQVCNFTISCNMSALPLYIEGSINVVKILREDSLVVINAVNIYKYVPFNFINVASWHLFSVTVIFLFSDHLSFFPCAEIFKCIMHFPCDFSLVRSVFISITHFPCTNIFPFCRTESTFSMHNIPR